MLFVSVKKHRQNRMRSGTDVRDRYYSVDSYLSAFGQN